MKLVGPSANPSLAFTNSLRGRDNGVPFSIQKEQVGELLVTSGSIIACDPYFLPLSRPKPYTTKIPPGRYPVFVSGIQSEGICGGRVAFAQVQLSKQEGVRWEMALRPGEDVSTLAPDHFFGYGVDSGTSCFLDQDVQAWLLEQFKARGYADWSPPQTQEEAEAWQKRWEAMTAFFYDQVGDPLLRILESSRLGAGSMTLKSPTGGNIVAFHSGYGDGSYPSYFLYTAEGSLSSLITDFGIFQDVEWDSPLS
ncbi:DUF4241 domain-containing protein [Ktedonosporobacter rubrisoli]|nr:DUF4241 domain-containing protein [Ktedonosporobacter rubrisoli]